ncbi:PspC domain-containing protein [Pedobacter chitinilyticus]|uniref:PspC domain-containing protein n=1 Tax=Pedobacter chitinilyticus TaxID=2233776 RepID=A0A443YX44_9SPHI|nr:PspC domain-containing protein [Pedobacter chitinilyticus]RWU08559.1 PspC domain-containing protein [Pedobacter chitinilyticus]
MEKKLYRNEHDKTVAGVASGLADYMQIDVTIVRLLFVLTTIFLAGSGVLAYIILWIVAPVNNDPAVKFKQFNDFYKYNPQGGSVFNSPEAFADTQQETAQTKWNTQNADAFTKFETPQKMKGNDTGKTVVGLILLVLGVYFLMRQLGLVPHWFNIFHIYKLWPLAIVALGISLIFRNQRKNEWENFKKTTEEAQRKTEQPTDAPASTGTTEENNSNNTQA